MIYPIVIYGASELKALSAPIEKGSIDVKTLSEDMFATMYQAGGVGLAAPQIGMNIRMFVIDASPWAEEEPALADFKKTFINAEIYEYGDEEDYFSEGCLSLPGLYEDVKRPTSIRIRYVDENWEEHDEFYDGYAARVIQHEYDHLDGKVFTDRLSPLRKKLVKGKLVGFTKGKYKASYRTK